MKIRNVIQLMLFLASLLASASLSAQQIILDSPVKAGPLTLFPDMEDPTAYYYLSDKPHIAIGENGKPKFSFLRFVENAKTGGAASGSKSEGEGGGIVHALIELGVTPEQRSQAEQELKRVNGSGRIVGPIVYTGGTIALISSIAQPNGEYAKTVLGLGKAPILDGQQAAVSVMLTKKGAKILRESFNTPTPDMSISFEMTISGFRKPKKAIIEANFESIYEHKAFQAAVAAPILQAEINVAFDDLVKSGAIKVINKGADEQMEALITDAYNKLTRMMFEATGGTGTPSLDQLSSLNGGRPSMLDRATTMLNASRTEARADNAAIRAENRAAATTSNSAADPEVAPAPATATATTTDAPATVGTEVAPRPVSSTPRPPRTAPTAAARESNRANPAPAQNTTPQRQEQALPSVAIAMSFEMRRVRQSGTYRIDLEKWSKDNLTMRFDENFGQIKCAECFRDINLDDPLYRQREVTTFLDGFDSQDFGKYINFVSVLLKKKHEGGDITEDELRIDKNNFNAEGNNFALVYGWKNDNNSKKWSEYEYKTVWNFFGGGLVESAWQKANINTIPLAAPFVRNEVLIESDPDVMRGRNIRSAEVKFFYKIADKEQTKQVRLNMKQDQFSSSADIYVPRNNTAFDYEVTWFAADGSSKNSGRLKSTNTVIYIDNIPQ
ncbi:MAG: hypothetical protein IT262_17450 [Saprospiraceae bacterium]|nr:hypothetical protein [Saprospiraceae bacterium]